MADLFILAACVILALGSPLTLAMDFYISPTGNDTWTGTLSAPNVEANDGPFATITRARTAIREWKKAHPKTHVPITVHLRQGLHTLAEPFALTAEDSGTPVCPITYQAFGREKVEVTGGREVQGFKPVTDEAILKRLDEKARGHVLQADLKGQGLADFGKAVAIGERLELFFDDRPMTLTRWPNEGFVTIAEINGPTPANIRGAKGCVEGIFTYEGDRPKRWLEESETWLLGYWFWDWADQYMRVESIDPDQRRITLAKPFHAYGYRKGMRYYALNVLAELDTPGEWYLDRTTGMLYFWPPRPIEAARTFVSVLPHLITMKDVSYVTLRGLILEHSRHDAVTITGGRCDRVLECRLRNLGGKAVAINEGTAHGVESCDIHDTGNGGITITGGDRAKLIPAGHYALDNDISRYSRVRQTYATAVTAGGMGNRIAHNRIHHAPHMAIGLSGNDHVIEFNEVFEVCMETDDAGAFYIGRDYTWRGNIVRYNYFHHIGQYTGGPVGVQSIYLDDFLSGTRVFGNICYRGGRGLLVGGGRNNAIENNVFIDCTPAIHIDARGLGWAKDYFNQKTNTLTERLAGVPYREEPWSLRYPALLTLYDDEPAVPKDNTVARNICVGGRWLDLHGVKPEWVPTRDNLVGVDPHFVDPDGGNFQLRDDSPAWELGFQRIPVEKIGLLRPLPRTRQ